MSATLKLPRLAKALSLTLIILILASNASSAFAYNRYGARDYAERWVYSSNPNYPAYGADCTNFVSQALHSGGGYSYVRYGYYWPSAWWCRWTWWGGFSNSSSWSVAHDLRTFLLVYDWPGGWQWNYSAPCGNWVTTVDVGDLLFYDWQGDGYFDHAAIEVVERGVDPRCGLQGDLVDQHSTQNSPLQHAIWHLIPYNDYRWTTRVSEVHIDDRNL